MNPAFTIRPDRAAEMLRQAATSQTPITLTAHLPEGWLTLKGRFAGVDEAQQLLHVELWTETGGETLTEAGQNLGVAFRSGHRKCVFNTAVVDGELGPPRRRSLRLLWPEDIHELQRRLYYRTEVPSSRLIPVDIWPAGANESPDPLPRRGRMLDLSAGGLSLELPREARPRWREGDQVNCRFAAPPGQEPLNLTARLQHYRRLDNGHVRLGLQFVGLDMTARGRSTLQVIHQLANRLRYVRSDDRPPARENNDTPTAW